MRLRRDWRRIRAGMVWIVLGAMMFFVFLVPQHAYGATQCPATREECQSFIDILVDSYVEEVGADNEAVYVVGPEPVFDLASGDPVFSGTQCWSVYCCDELAAFIFSVETDEGITFTLSTGTAETLAENFSFSPGETAQIAMRGDDLLYVAGESGDAYLVYDNGVCNPCDEPLQSLADTLNQTPRASRRVSSAKSAPVTVTSSKTLGVPYVSQGNNPICWAASACQAGRYLTGNTGWTAVSLCNAVKGTLAGGTVADTRDAYTRFTYSGSATRIATTHVSGAPTESVIGHWINAGLPIHARTSSNNGSGHAVIIDGYKTYSSGAMALRLVNPGIANPGVVFATKSSGYYHFFYNTSEGNTFKWDRGSVVFTGWQRPFGGSRWSYFSSSGAKTTGWLKSGNYWYWFDSSGMTTGWQKVSGKWYWMDSGGAAVTGWKKIGSYWYAFDSSCAMRTGWFKDGSTWYYLRTATNTPASGPEGAMLAGGTWTIGGKAYRFDSSGACLNP